MVWHTFTEAENVAYYKNACEIDALRSSEAMGRSRQKFQNRAAGTIAIAVILLAITAIFVWR
ncbi:hypothetical protein [Sphingomonas mollis]|uniref:Uncharacterized protein n=1 Tax=Sphingomonas mollis TaxID=2795726 RepID=A0ABS0XUQ9_9SPHN|nr:hypothetical protein [Sphingomonas sp. BT553]MBJ6123769.1 hypothetical protein [Sphingomonas sp. BT553]